MSCVSPAEQRSGRARVPSVRTRGSTYLPTPPGEKAVACSPLTASPADSPRPRVSARPAPALVVVRDDETFPAESEVVREHAAAPLVIATTLREQESPVSTRTSVS